MVVTGADVTVVVTGGDVTVVAGEVTVEVVTVVVALPEGADMTPP